MPRKDFSVTFEGKKLLLNGKPIKRLTCSDGASRDVFTNGKVVVKIDNDHSEDQCMVEYNVFQKIKRKDLKHFAPIVGFGDIQRDGRTRQYVIQKFVNRKRGRISEKSRDVIYNLKSKYNIADMHSGNWCVNKKGNPVIFDLGIQDY